MSSKSDTFIDLSERFLGKNVGQFIEVLGETACMEKDYRILHVLLKHYPLIDKFLTENSKATDIETIQKIIAPLFDDLGHVNWNRDILTDLAFALSQHKGTNIKMDEKENKDLGQLFKKNP